MKKVLILLAALNAILIVVFLQHNLRQPDTGCYELSAKLLFNLPGGGDCGYRMIKPFPLLFSGFLEKFMGIEVAFGLFFENLLMYFFLVILLFEIIELVFKNRWQAFGGSFVFMSAPPMLIYGLAYLTDLPGWFFGILGVYLTLKYFEKEKFDKLTTFLIGGIIGLGFLFKESALAGIIFFVVFALLHPFPLKKKISLLFLGSLGFIIPIIISSLIIEYVFHYSFFTWYQFNLEKPYGDIYTGSEFLRAVAGTLYFYWFLGLLGIYLFVKSFREKKITRPILQFLLAGGATLLLWPLWPYPHPRIFFLSLVFLVSIVSYSILSFTPKKGLFLILLTGIMNFVSVALYTSTREVKIIYAGTLLYFLIFLFFLLLSASKPKSQSLSIKQG